MASILDLKRMNDSGDLAGGVSEVAAVAGPGAMVTAAVRTESGRLKLITWQLNTAGPVTRLGDSGDAAGKASSIGIARGDRFVTSCRTSEGKLKLISWDVDGTGTFITRRGDSGNQAGEASQICIVAMSGTVFVIACRTGGGNLRLISWQLRADGSILRLSDSAEAAGKVLEISLLRQSADRVITAVRRQNGDLRLIAWSVSAGGAFARLGDSDDAAGEASLIRTSLTSGGLVITAVRDSSGDLKLISWRVSAAGEVTRLKDSGGQAGDIGDNSLAILADGVVSAVRTAEGHLKLIAWLIGADGVITRRGDSSTQAGSATQICLLPGPGVPDANGHSVTLMAAVRTGDGNLRLITWGPPIVRLHFKVLAAPNIGTGIMLNTMQQVYGTVGIGVTLATTENLNLPLLNTVDTGSCTVGNTTGEQEQLFANRNNVGDKDVAVYFVLATNPPLNGCAAHPPGRPSVVVAQGATQFTMAHEVGHVLGLRHVNDRDRLMTGGGTGNITNLPPDLIPAEQSTMIGSPFTIPA